MDSEIKITFEILSNNYRSWCWIWLFLCILSTIQQRSSQNWSSSVYFRWFLDWSWKDWHCEALGM